MASNIIASLSKVQDSDIIAVVSKDTKELRASINNGLTINKFTSGGEHVSFTVVADGYDQTFTDTKLEQYAIADSINIFKNGIYLSPSLITIVDKTTIQINDHLEIGDVLDIAATGSALLTTVKPAGVFNSVQFNDGGIVGGTSTLTYNKVTNTLNVGNIVANGSQLTNISFGNLIAKPTTIAGYGITDAQPLDADLTSISNVVGASGILKKTAPDTWALDTNVYLTGITASQVNGALGYTPYNGTTNPNGFLTSVDNSQIISAIGYTPYNASNPAGYISSITSGNVITALGYTPYNGTSNPNGYTSNTGTVTSVSGGGTVNGLTLSGNITSSGNLTLGGTLALTNGQITTALGYTPYNATNPNGYISSITSGNVTTALGYTPYNSTNPAGYISSITSSNVTTALGYTPYNATNPAGYLSSITSGNVTTALGYTPINPNQKGVANGIATLDSNGTVPASQLPAYVDDIIEVANYAALPTTGVSGKIYITLDNNNQYRWSGTVYVQITSSPGSTDAVPEGATNLYFTTSRARNSITASGSLTYSPATGIISYTQPTNVSAFTNDAGYITASANITGSAAKLSGGLANQIAYQTAPNTTSFITAPSITNTYLKWNGTSYEWSVVSGSGTQIQSDYTQTNNTLNDYIKNKPEYYKPTVGIYSGVAYNRFADALLDYGSMQAGNDYPVGVPVWTSATFGTSRVEPTVIGQVLTYSSTGTITWQTPPSGTQADWNQSVNTANDYIKNKPTALSAFTNDSGYLTNITSSNVTTALGYTPYNATNPAGYLTGITASQVNGALGYTAYNGTTNPSGFLTSASNVAWSKLTGIPTTLAGHGITDAQPLDADLTSIAGLTGTTGLLKKTAANTWTLDTSTYLTGITSGQVTTALGYTPYNGTTNPNGYLTGITSGQVTTALGYTPYNGTTNPNNYLTTSSNLAWANLTGKPTTIAGYGITDAQPLDADLTSIAGLTGTTGMLKKTAADTWTLDTATYLTSASVATEAAKVTNALSFATDGTGATGVTFDGSTARSISYNSVGAPSVGGANATGTWPISITGSSATVSGATQSAITSVGTLTALNVNARASITTLAEKQIAVTAMNIDCATGAVFTKTISAATTFTVSNPAGTTNVSSFILELTNGGAFAITWWAGVKWASGTAPTLTTSGVDILGFYTYDGGTTWRGMLLSKDSK